MAYQSTPTNTRWGPNKLLFVIPFTRSVLFSFGETETVEFTKIHRTDYSKWAFYCYVANNQDDFIAVEPACRAGWSHGLTMA